MTVLKVRVISSTWRRYYPSELGGARLALLKLSDKETNDIWKRFYIRNI